MEERSETAVRSSTTVSESNSRQSWSALLSIGSRLRSFFRMPLQFVADALTSSMVEFTMCEMTSGNDFSWRSGNVETEETQRSE